MKSDSSGFHGEGRGTPESTASATPEPTPESTPDHSATDGGSDARLEQLEARLASLERALEEQPGDTQTEAVFDEPELLHKVVHACMDSPNITEDEELRILRALLTPATMPSGE